jgi:hypothetical protein
MTEADIKQINRTLCYIPILYLAYWSTMVIIGLFKFGRLPKYGDPDPYSLSIDWLDFIAIIPALISFVSIPTTFFLTLHLLLTRTNLSHQDKIALTVFIISVSTLVLSKFFLTSTFEWVMD